MSSNEWHVAIADLKAYVGGDVGPVGRASLESHVTDCAACRSVLAGLRPARREELWDRIADRIDVPRRPLRWSTTALTVSVSSPLLLGVTAALSVGLLISVAIAAMVGDGWAARVLLSGAPIAPAVGAAIAFRREVDPAGELAEATSLAAGRLPFLRSLVVSVCMFTTGAIASLITTIGWESITFWVLPASAMAAVVLAAATWVDPTHAAAVLTVGWGGAITVWSNRQRRMPPPIALDQLFTHRPAVQLFCVVVTISAGLICVRRRSAVPVWRTT